MLRSVLISALVLGAVGGRLGASTSAAARAKVWLHEHQIPDAAGLADLKASDPNSFAIVQALLVKQQNGELDPSNPGGFKHEEHESAADIMRAAPTIQGTGLQPVSELAFSAPAVTHAEYKGNPLAFNAKQADDDAMSIITGGSSPSSDETPQPISEVAISAPVQRRPFAAPASDEEKEERAALNKENSIMAILGGSGPSSPSGASAYISQVAIKAPVRHAQYTPPVQPAARGPLSFDRKKADDDIMSMIGGDPSPSDAGEVSKPISEVAISAPVQHAEYTPPVQSLAYTPPAQPISEVAISAPVQPAQYTPPASHHLVEPWESMAPPVQKMEYTPPVQPISEVAIAAPVQHEEYTPPVQSMAYTPPVQEYTPPAQPMSAVSIHRALQAEYAPPVQSAQYTPPVQQAEYGSTSSLLSSKRSTVSADSSAPPDVQGLEEFKNADPNGYAVVQDLLSKQQTGMLDASNPAGFKHEEHTSAVDIMRSAPSIEGASVPMSELAMSAPVTQPTYYHGNPMAFNAKKADDDALSIITGGSPPSSADALSIQPISQLAVSAPVHHADGVSAMNEQVLSILGGTEPSSSQRTRPSMSAVAIASPVRRQLSFNAKKADDDIMSMIGGDSSPSNAGEARPAASMMKQSSYLSQINFPMKDRVQQSAQVQVPHVNGGLQSFSWDEYGDVASGRVQTRRAPTQYIQQQVDDTVDLDQMNQKYESMKVKGGAISDWLAPKHEAAEAQPAKVEEKQESESAYDKKDPNDAASMDNYINWAHSGAFQ